MPSPAAPVRTVARTEYPTIALVGATYAAWAAATLALPFIGPVLAVPLLGGLIAFHSSLQHEAIHGHPTRHTSLNDLMVFPALGLLLPYERFRDLHLAHHRDPNLTDPYDDPESNYLDPAVWIRLPAPARWLLEINNTLLGRVVIGPVVGTLTFWGNDLAAWRRGEPGIARAYGLHLVAAAPVVLWLALAGVPAWAYGAACWVGLGLLKIRTFLEHRAHASNAARSVIIEDRGPLAFLFLNNNLHAVHHARPQLPWYALPGEYAARKALYLGRNGGYRYRSYAEVAARHLLRRKDPVPHPMMPNRAVP